VHLTAADRELLRAEARRSIEHGLATDTELAVSELDFPEPLRVRTATFVTLRHRGQLLGCLGTLRPIRALVSDVVHNAHHAAFSDLRFEAVTSAHLPGLDLHIAILSPLEPLVVRSEAELHARLRIGVDGVVIAEHGLSATFLPVMWNRFDDPCMFLQALKEKAGLPVDYWSSELQVFRYTTEEV
jgi:AmmeMemoRadiSam system protein A